MHRAYGVGGAPLAVTQADAAWADMLDVAFMGLHVAQMTSPQEMARCFTMVTEDNAAILGLPEYGLAPGRRASSSSRSATKRACA